MLAVSKAGSTWYAFCSAAASSACPRGVPGAAFALADPYTKGSKVGAESWLCSGWHAFCSAAASRACPRGVPGVALAEQTPV